MKPIILGLSHDHIDGNRSLMLFIETLYREAGIKFEFKNTEQWYRYLRNSEIPINIRFRTITQVLQSEELLKLMAFTYATFRSGQGYLSVEGKFAPQYHTQKGLTMRQVTRAIYDGLSEAEEVTGIKTRPFHICIGREADENLAMQVAKIAIEYDGEAILDLAGNEPENPPEKHRKAYESTFGTNVKRDCHAGEWIEDKPRKTYRERLLKNIRTAIFDLKCHSIGHAIPLIYDKELVRYVVDNQIRICMCPLSNLTLGHINTIQELGITELLDAGAWVTLNSDDDLFLPDMEEVTKQCDLYCNFSLEQCRKLEENSIRPL